LGLPHSSAAVTNGGLSWCNSGTFILTPSNMQKSVFNLECPAKKTLTRRDRFLAEIESVTAWSKLHKLVEPFYPKLAGVGRPQIRLACMLRMYVTQQCFGLWDEGIEDAIQTQGAAQE
jgi:hypothetical protein